MSGRKPDFDFKLSISGKGSKFLMGTLATVLAAKALYIGCSWREETIVQKSINGSLMLDAYNRAYRFPGLCWFWRPESIMSLEAGRQYRAKVYGYRIPLLCIYPNIVMLNMLN